MSGFDVRFRCQVSDFRCRFKVLDFRFICQDYISGFRQFDFVCAQREKQMCVLHSQGLDVRFRIQVLDFRMIFQRAQRETKNGACCIPGFKIIVNIMCFAYQAWKSL